MERIENNTVISVGLVENREVVLRGLDRMLDREGFRVCWRAATLDDACAALDAYFPDVVLIGSGRVLAFREEVARISARSDMIVLMDEPDEAMQDHMIIAGARGILSLNDREELMLRAISCVRSGELWIDRIAARRVIDTLTERRPHLDLRLDP